MSFCLAVLRHEPRGAEQVVMGHAEGGVLKRHILRHSPGLGGGFLRNRAGAADRHQNHSSCFVAIARGKERVLIDKNPTGQRPSRFLVNRLKGRDLTGRLQRIMSNMLKHLRPKTKNVYRHILTCCRLSASVRTARHWAQRALRPRT